MRSMAWENNSVFRLPKNTDLLINFVGVTWSQNLEYIRTWGLVLVYEVSQVHYFQEKFLSCLISIPRESFHVSYITFWCDMQIKDKWKTLVKDCEERQWLIFMVWRDMFYVSLSFVLSWMLMKWNEERWWIFIFLLYIFLSRDNFTQKQHWHIQMYIFTHTEMEKQKLVHKKYCVVSKNKTLLRSYVTKWYALISWQSKIVVQKNVRLQKKVNNQ